MDGWVGGRLMTVTLSSRCSLFCAKRDDLIPTKSTAQEGKANKAPRGRLAVSETWAWGAATDVRSARCATATPLMGLSNNPQVTNKKSALKRCRSTTVGT